MSANSHIPERVLFTREMKKDYTILVPTMLPIHFALIQKVLQRAGYRVEILQNCGHSVVEEGLKYVHNDTCYPALLVIGQMIDALNSGKYDISKTALLITQTGGGCRASNYIHLLRKALVKAGYAHIPVISANLSGLESNPGFQITLPLLRRCLAAVAYGDFLTLLANQTRPYEQKHGEADALVDAWVCRLAQLFDEGKGLGTSALREYLELIACDFEKIAVDRRPKVKVGVVGEIYVKYSSLANNGLEAFLASQDCEVMVPGLMSFMLFKTDNRLEDINLYGGSSLKYGAVSLLMKLFLGMERATLDVLEQHPAFVAPTPYHELKGLVRGIIGYGAKMGEGWLLTAEMLELAKNGYGNIVCAQPFGCLPNHICGKGMIRRIREVCPEANIVAIDYDPSATRVNQENRIKLMLAVGREALEQQNAPGTAAAEKQPVLV